MLPRTLLLLTALLACGEARTAPVAAPTGSDPPAEAPPPQAPPMETPPGREAAGPIAVVHAHVLPMTGEGPLDDYAVLVEDGRIAWIGPTTEIAMPDDAEVIDAGNGWLLPGLVDLHVHLDRADLEAYVRHGVTTVRNMWGFPDVQAMQSEIEAGEILGPTIFTTSPGLDGRPPTWPLTQFVTDPSQADSVVTLQAANGYRTLKIYQNLTREAYDAIVVTARARGMDFVGHVPHRVGLERVLQAGQRSLAHLGGFETVLAGGGRGLAAWAEADVAAMPALAARVRASGATVVPTQAIVQNLQRNLPATVRGLGLLNRRRMIAALHDAGVPVLAGTDSGIDVTAPGASLADEIEELRAAGLSTREALAAATVDAARFLGGEGEFGTIEVGARADLLLVPGNPLAGLDALRHPAAVVVRGVRIEAP